MERTYFVVEGPHDVAAVDRLLRRRSLERIRKMDKLDSFWSDLVPRRFPYKQDLLGRVPVPRFFLSEEHSVAVQAAGGDVERVTKTVRSTLTTLEERPDGLGVLVDADYEKPPVETWEEFEEAFSTELDDIGDGPGEVGGGSPRTGIFILPDNDTEGTLEDILLPCAEKAYPELTTAMTEAIDPIDPEDRDYFPRYRDRRDIKQPAGKKKAKVGAIANMLRPGKAVQVSIQDNDWLRNDDARNLSEVQSLQAFIDEVAGLPVDEESSD